MPLHHVSLFVRDAEASLRFYRDGLGFQVFVDREFEGEWPTLFGVKSERLRAIIMGDPDAPHAGGVELVTFAEPVPEGPPPAPPVTSTVMLALFVDLDVVLPKVLEHGGSDPKRAQLRSSGAGAATVRDPDGILVELLDAGHRTPQA
jgi:catechol 2,3-dioxygenase-like lactoylglutathione lyase family enzyme